MELTFGAPTLSATVSLWHTPGRPGPGQKQTLPKHAESSRSSEICPEATDSP